jgi:hypothetical protein
MGFVVPHLRSNWKMVGCWMRSMRWTSVVVLHIFSSFPSTNGGAVVATGRRNDLTSAAPDDEGREDASPAACFGQHFAAVDSLGRSSTQRRSCAAPSLSYGERQLEDLAGSATEGGAHGRSSQWRSRRGTRREQRRAARWRAGQWRRRCYAIVRRGKTSLFCFRSVQGIGSTGRRTWERHPRSGRRRGQEPWQGGVHSR